jgi:UrcA family protein
MNTITTSANLRRTAATALFSALASFAAVCPAADSTDPLQATVQYGDLNVSSHLGAATLYSRIQAAAGRVCRPFDNRDLASKKLLNMCIHKAIADAVTKVDQPELSAVYNAKNGTSQPILLAARETR